MGCGASSTNGPLAGPSGSGLAGVRGLRQHKVPLQEQIQPVFGNTPGLDAADAKIVGKIAARDLADDETTIGCGESITGDFGDNLIDEIGADEIPAPVDTQPSKLLMQKLALSFLESAKSGVLAAALALQQTSQSSDSSYQKPGDQAAIDSPAPQTLLKEKLSLSFVQSAKSGALSSAFEQLNKEREEKRMKEANAKLKLSLSFVQSAKTGALSSAFEQLNKEREEKRMKEADAKMKLCKALVGSAKDGGLAAAFSKALAERK